MQSPLSKPVDIQVDITGKTLTLMWENGLTQQLSHVQLRQHCPCGFCRAKRVKGQIIVVPNNIQITAMFDQGYGAQICFNDGHDQGIFPWVYLHDLQ